MKTKSPLTPFPIRGYHGKKYFCDRNEETKKLILNLSGGINTTLFSIRRLGKTGLIQHVFSQMETTSIKIFVDLLPTTNLKDFVSVLASALYRGIPQKSSFGKIFFNFLKSLRPQISYDSLTGMPEVTLNIDKSNTEELTFNKIIEFLRGQDKNIIIAIDEFQQITTYPEKNIEAILRTGFQHLSNTTFIFCGSQQHLLTEMFTTAKRPFFGSTQMMKLQKINHESYKKFINKKFTESDIKISPEEIDTILNWTKRHTFYTQLICNKLFVSNMRVIDNTILSEIFNQVLLEQETVFYNYQKLLTASQWKLLKAIAKEQVVYQPTSKNFINDHNLGTPAMVKRSLEALLKKEVIYQEFDEHGKSYFEVYDVFLSRWLEYKTL